jgi:uncharacterized DUF497 family protein
MGETVRLRVGDLEFEWDVEKSVFNMKKHGVSFLEAATSLFRRTKSDDSRSRPLGK